MRTGISITVGSSDASVMRNSAYPRGSQGRFGANVEDAAGRDTRHRAVVRAIRSRPRLGSAMHGDREEGK
jgi:hypothetical protein